MFHTTVNWTWVKWKQSSGNMAWKKELELTGKWTWVKLKQSSGNMAGKSQYADSMLRVVLSFDTFSV